MTYVMSGLHGRWDLYTKMLEKIGFSSEDRLYILGDVVGRDRGGIRILKDILERPNVRSLLGEQEHMLLHAVTAPEERAMNGRDMDRRIWYRNGGRAIQAEWDAQPEPVRRRLLQLIGEMPLNITVEVGGTSFLLCHASPVCMFREYGASYPDATAFALWHRMEPWMDIRPAADVLIFGHTPTAYYSNSSPMEIFRLKDEVYAIDCGCADREDPERRLGCMRLEDRSAIYVGTEDLDGGDGVRPRRMAPDETGTI